MSETSSPPAEGPFERVETRPPEQGRSMESALAEMKRRAAAPPVSQAVAPLQLQQPFAQVPQAQTNQPALPPPDAVMPGATMAPPVSQSTGSAPADLVVHVEIDGQMVPLTVSELQRGYLREQDYRRKTQASAQELRRAQEAQQQFQHARQQLEQRLPQFINQYQQEFSAPVDWEKLSKEDPIGTGQKVARLLAWQQALQEQANLKQLEANENHARKTHLMQIGHEVLCKVVPGWADPPTRAVIQQALASHAVSMGYAPEQVSNAEVLDPREIFMCWKSMNYDRLMAQRVMPQPVGARTVEGNGSGRRHAEAPGLQEAEERFRQTHRMDDAVLVARLRAEAGQRVAAPAQPLQPTSRWR